MNDRTEEQNRYYWGVVLKILSKKVGVHPLEIHSFCKINLMPVKKTSTTNLNKKEFTEYLKNIKNHFRKEWSVEFPEKNMLK
jgi:hypothetical protein